MTTTMEHRCYTSVSPCITPAKRPSPKRYDLIGGRKHHSLNRAKTTTFYPHTEANVANFDRPNHAFTKFTTFYLYSEANVANFDPIVFALNRWVWGPITAHC